jgi:transposase
MTKIKTIKDISGVSAIGIDVSRDTLDICFLKTDGSNEEYLQIKNERKPLERLTSALAGYQGKTVMESTGRHHLLAAIILSAQDQDVRVVNPLLTGKYTKSSIRKVKTDRRDSKVLALMALIEEDLPQPFSANEITANMRKKINLVAFLDKQLQQLNSSLNDYQKTKKILNMEMTLAEQGVIDTIAELKTRKERLEQEIKDDLSDIDPNDQERIDHPDILVLRA